MFTGIVKALGTIERMDAREGTVRYSICSRDLPWLDYESGDSICVNGVCLTAVGLRNDGFECDVSLETLQVTTMRDLEAGSRVNLEPALGVGDRLGGHLVSGHVDCVGTVVGRGEDSGSIRLQVGLPAEYRRYAARKGSICVDGVSLTINEVSGNIITVNIIPHTAKATIAGSYDVGSAVNIEVDQLARYLESLLDARDEMRAPDASASGVTKELLRAHGYA